MVAVPLPQGLTADLFLQMTATLAHISQLKNSTVENSTLQYSTVEAPLYNVSNTTTFFNVQRGDTDLATQFYCFYYGQIILISS